MDLENIMSVVSLSKKPRPKPSEMLLRLTQGLHKALIYCNLDTSLPDCFSAGSENCRSEIPTQKKVMKQTSTFIVVCSACSVCAF